MQRNVKMLAGWKEGIRKELLGSTPCTIYRRGAKLDLIVRGGESDILRKGRKG